MTANERRRPIRTSLGLLLVLGWALTTSAAGLPGVPLDEVKLNAGMPEVGSPDRTPQAFALADGQLAVLALEDFRLRSLYSSDGGAVFEAEVDAAENQTVFSFRAVLTDDGWLLAVVSVADPQGGVGLSSIRSADMGRTWSAPTPIVAFGDPGHGVFKTDLRIAAGPGGLVALSFLQTATGDLFLTATEDSGGGWSAPLKINQLDGPLWVADVAVDRNSGHIYVVTDETFLTGNGSCSGCAKAAVRRSTDAGVTLDPAVFIRPNDFTDAFFSAIHVADDGGVLVAYKQWDWDFLPDFIEVFRSTDGAASFPRFALAHVPTGGYFDFFPFPRWHADPADSTIFLSWISTPGNLEMRRSVDNGASFGPTVTLSGPFAVDHYALWEHEFARTSSGSWSVVWRDSRDRSETQVDDIYARSSADGGATWMPEQRVNETTLESVGALQPSLASPGGNQLFVVYEDSRQEGGRSEDLFARAGQAAPLVLGPDRRIDADAGSATTNVDFGVAIASDGVSDVHVAFATNAVGLREDLYMTSSLDAGRQFSAPVKVNTSPTGVEYSVDPEVVATPDGYVHVLFFSEAGDGSRPQLRFNRSADRGATWLMEDRTFADVWPVDASISAVEGGTVHLAWAEGENIVLATSIDGGISFGLSEMADGIAGTKRQPRLRSRGDRVILGWSTSRGELWASVSADRGSTFSAPTRVDSGQGGSVRHLDVDCLEDGRGVLAWNKSGGMFVSTFDGNSWDPMLAVDNSPSPFLRNVQVAYSEPAGEKVVVVYSHSASGSGHSPFSHVSLDGGLSFSPYRPAGDGAALASNSISLDLATDRLGNVWMFWMNYVEGVPTPVFQRSTDGGVTFGPMTRLDGSDPPGTYGNGTSFLARQAAALPGTGLFAWWGVRSSVHRDALFNADDLFDPERDGRVAVCHASPRNPSRARTLQLPTPAVRAHLAHGDTLGECPPCEESEPVVVTEMQRVGESSSGGRSNGRQLEKAARSVRCEPQAP